MPKDTPAKLSTSKAEILDAAAEVFMSLGADNASIDDVARHLGATKGRVYHHFPSKGVLLAEVCLRASDFVRKKVPPVIVGTDSPEQKLRAMVLTHVPEVLRTLPYHKVIIQSYVGMKQKSTTEQERALFAQIHKERKDYENLFRKVLQSGMDDGSFRKQNTSVALHSVLLLINAPVFWYRPREDQPEEFVANLSQQLADMAVASLR